MSHITDNNTRTISLIPFLSVHDPNASLCEKHIAERGVNLFCLSLAIPISFVHIVMATISSVGVILTGSLYKPVNNFTTSHFKQGASCLVPVIYFLLLRTLNPSAPFPTSCRIGIISHIFCDNLFPIHKELLDSDSFFQRHFVSRGLALPVIPITLITSVADLSIGLTAATLSIVTVGYFETINIVAIEGLFASIMITGLFGATVSVINPWAFD